MKKDEKLKKNTQLLSHWTAFKKSYIQLLLCRTRLNKIKYIALHLQKKLHIYSYSEVIRSMAGSNNLEQMKTDYFGKHVSTNWTNYRLKLIALSLYLI
jgi:hypothetical protein